MLGNLLESIFESYFDIAYERNLQTWLDWVLGLCLFYLCLYVLMDLVIQIFSHFKNKKK